VDTDLEDTVGQYDITAGTENWDVPLNANLDNIDSRISVTESVNGTQSTQIATLQGNVSANTSDIATANANIATNTTNIATNTGNITTLQGQMSSVTTTANNAVPKDALVINVKDHGAAGDGTTDDRAAIATSIGLLGSGGILYFPPGNYLVNSGSALTISQPIQVMGAGQAATTIRIGSSFAQAQLFNVTSNDVTFADIQIRGNSTTTTSNPVCDGILATASQSFKMLNVTMQWINGYAVKVFASAASTIHGGQIDNVKIQSCAGGLYIKGDNASGNVAANFQVSNLFTRFLGVNSGGSANLDGIRIEDAWDVLLDNCFAWMNATTGGTGVATRVVGNCAATFILNLDALGPQTGPANVSIEANGNGSPQNVQITGGVIQQGTVGLRISDAATQVRVGTVRFINNQTHGAVVSTSGPAIYFDSVFFSGNGAGATGTNYDLNWSGTTTGFVTNCRFASAIVAVNNAGVQQSINITAGQNVRFFNADFQGTGAAQANWFTNLPAYATTNNVGNQRFAFLTDVDFNYATGPGRVSIQPFAATNNCLSTNVQGTGTNDNFRLLGNGNQQFGPGGASPRDTTWGRQGSAQIGTPDSEIFINAQGKSLRLLSGGAAQVAGTVTASATTPVAVATTAATANSVVVLSYKSGTQGATAAFVSSLTAGTGFSIKSVTGDTAVYNWMLFNFS